MDPQGLLGEEGTPAGEEVVVPPPRRVVRTWCTDGDAPTKMVRRVHPRSERLVHVGGVQPVGELGVLGDATLETFGEAQEGVGAGVAAAGGEGLLVVDLPEQQKRHARLADGGISWTKEAVMPNPVSQARVHVGHGGVLPGGW